MIRPLRRLHRWVILLLAVGLTLLFILGLLARRPAPVVPLPTPLRAAAAAGNFEPAPAAAGKSEAPPTP